MSGDLRSMQEDFARALLAGDDAGLASRLDAPPGAAGRSIAIYRRAVTANLVGALRAAYPVVVRLVGDAFFHEAARRHSWASPPVSGDLNRHGGGFGDFLEGYGPAGAMPWLPDVARLEWACQEAMMAAEGAPLDFARLGEVPADRRATLRFDLHPSVRVIRSPWPVLAIWEANQADRDGTPDRGEGSDRVLVWRSRGGVRTMRLEVPEAAFVEGLGRGDRIAAAAGDGDWDLPRCLAMLASEGVLGPFRDEIPAPPGPISA